MQYKLAEPVAVVRYALTSANDAPERDPQDWTLQGSADGQTWTTLDTQADQTFAERFQTKEYRFANTDAVPATTGSTSPRNGGATSSSSPSWQLSDGDTDPAAARRHEQPARQRARPARPTAKAGRRLHRAQGAPVLRPAHSPRAAAYSYNKVFDVDSRSTRDTELSYLIFPEFTATTCATRPPTPRSTWPSPTAPT